MGALPQGRPCGLHHTMRRITRQQIAAALGEIGVRKGSVLFVHSSLSSIGNVAGGAPEVVVAIRETLGEDGTLAVPAFTFSHPDGRVFDPRRDPSQMGAISEEARRLPGAKRSCHYLHSVAAAGPRCGELTCRHGASAWAADGPFWQLFELDADILLLGVPYTRCTQFHVVEQMVKVPYRQWVPVEAEVVEADGSRRKLPTCAYSPGQGFPGNDFNKFGRLLERRGLVRMGRVGNAVCRLLRARDVLAEGVAEYRKDQYLFVKTGSDITSLSDGTLVAEGGTERWVVDPSQVYPADS